MKNILITGGAGFIGSNLADQLLVMGHNVIVVDNLSTGNKKNLDKRIKFYKIDIQNKKIDKIFAKEKPEIVFHLAAQINVRKSVEEPGEDAKINIVGGLNILENCKKYNVKKIIFSSTGGAIYGDANIIPTPENYKEYPVSPYGISKLSLERYLNYYQKIFGLNFIALRFSNVFGPRQNSKGEAGVIAIFCDKIFSGKNPIINGDGLQTRDYVYVKDVVSALVLAMESEKVGIFNVGTGKETNVNEIFEIIKEASNFTGIAMHGAAQKGEQQRSCLDYSLIKKELGWDVKHDLKTAIKETVNWFKEKNK